MKKLLLSFLLVVPVVNAGSFTKLFKSSPVQLVVKKLPIVYSSLYDFYFLPFRAERLFHPFDGCKYSKVDEMSCRQGSYK